MKQIAAIVFLCWVALPLSAQQQSPTLHFAEDSFRIGMPTPVSLSYRHFWKQEVVFPDSAFDFSPFEFYRKEVFPTYTLDSISTDSVVYWLNSFEIDPVLTLKLPVFIHGKKDSFALYSNVDTIAFHPVIVQLSDTLTVKENTAQLPLDKTFNYPLFIIGLLVIGGLLVAAILGNQRKIRAFLWKWYLQRQHQRFIAQFDTASEQFLQSPQAADQLEKLLVIWKKYMQNLVKQPITTWSTREIAAIFDDREMIAFLRAADGHLFGGIPIEPHDVYILKTFANNTYTQQIDTLKNGRYTRA